MSWCWWWWLLLLSWLVVLRRSSKGCPHYGCHFSVVDPLRMFILKTPLKAPGLKDLKTYSGQVKLSTTTSNFIYFIASKVLECSSPAWKNHPIQSSLCVFNAPKKKCLPCFCPGGFQPNLCRLRCWDDVWKRFVFFRTSAELKD